MSQAPLDEAQRRAVDLPLEHAVVIRGAAGTGKTVALAARIERMHREVPSAQVLIVRTRADLAAAAFTVVASARPNAQRIDDVAGRALFAAVAEPLLSLSWDEFVGETAIDPEVPGLRHPQRFLDAAYRLITRLRDAAIPSSDFLAIALTGAADFGTRPPNLADPSLLAATKAAYRDSLGADATELARQYRREVDLAKIVARLYAEYVAASEVRGIFTDRDAISAATELLEAGARPAPPFRFACIDDAQDLVCADLRLLRALFTPQLDGVTLAGDPASAFDLFRAAQAEATLSGVGVAIELDRQHRTSRAVALAADTIARVPRRPESASVPADLLLHRAADERDEAAFIAADVASRIASGTPPESIAILFRSVSAVAAYEEALLERGVPVATFGDYNPFRDRRALDALALLWAAHDPFRHDWLLRVLEGPALRLSDASIALLCSEPTDPSQTLFALDQDAMPAPRAARWDPRRDLRLGWNVVRGDQDAALGAEARERLGTFRRMRSAWIDTMHRAPFDAFVREVWRALPREGPPGSARERSQQWLLRLLAERLRAICAELSDPRLGEILHVAEEHAASDLVRTEPQPVEGFVRLLCLDAARGQEFVHVTIARARAGSFPRWYVPDAFLFSPRHGLIPKENAGGTSAARTAKFTYYMHRSRARDRYNAQERSAFAYALRRSSSSVLVTASGMPTRGTTAPEFLEELRTARPQGSTIV